MSSPQDEHVGAADGIGFGVVVLAEEDELGVGVELAHVAGRFREHAAGAGSRIEQGANGAFLAEDVAIGLEQEVDHEADDLARGEVVSGFLVRRFVEFADKFFEAAPHFEVGNGVGVQVDLGELLDELEEAIRFIELLDLLIEPEVVEELAGFLGKGFRVMEKVLCETFGVVQEAAEVVLAGVIEGLSRGSAEHLSRTPCSITCTIAASGTYGIA